jgi:hypothetical protein
MSINDATPADWDELRKKHPALIKSYEAMVVEERKEDVDEMVERPPHYNYGSIECIEAIEESMTPEAFKGYLKGNALKYLWRYERKGHALQDLKKSQWYLDRLVDGVSE